MNSFTDRILINICPSGDDLIAISTYDILHGKSSRFMMMKNELSEILSSDSPTPILDTDLGNYIRVSRNRKEVHFKLTWLRNDFRNDVTGYVLDFDIPVEKLEKALSGRKVHHVEHLSDTQEKARLTFTDSGNVMLNKVCADKLTKHAIRRFFREHFNYGDQERLIIYPDNWIKGFYFQSAYSGYEGSIVRHEDIITGKNGREYRKIFYALHT